MKLRTQIFLLLFLFGLIPLLAAFLVNVPMIFDRIETLYHKAHVQNLRAGFSDLDQHLARRHEMVRLLAKMPEPGMLVPEGTEQELPGLESARSAYIDWVNQVLVDQLDVTRIVYLDDAGRATFWLDRNLNTARLESQAGQPDGLSESLLEAGRKVSPGNVITGPIEIDEALSETAPNRFMQLALVSPVVIPMVSQETGDMIEQRGEVLVYLDVGGLANAYRGNYWVQSDGRYLGDLGGSEGVRKAFDDFQGLEAILDRGEIDLWEFKGQQVLWVPLFKTENAGMLWVGRSVDPSPLSELLRTVQLRVAIVAAGLLVVVFVVARLIAVRSERLGHELTDGISRVLENDEAVTFSWQRPEELQQLGTDLTRLASTHAEHISALHDYAEELEASNRYKSEFLANVSHELRTPLNSILLLSKMLAENSGGELPDEQARKAHIIHAAGSDLKALIDNILDLSRVEARQMTLVEEAVDLRILLQDCVELMQPQFEDKQLQLETRIHDDVPETITSDGEKLRQILINFLSNAVKFTERGGVTVELAGAGQDLVCMRVTDTGIGIPADKQALVFEAFKQADGSTSRRFGGTGLGLTISRELARLLGGDIEVQSTPGQGTTFSVCIPRQPPEAATEPAAATAISDPAATQGEPIPAADYAGRRVLLVDDDVRNLLALTPLLEQWQLEVMAAGDGEEALETLAGNERFDVVLMDIMMPGMDGYEAMRRIRAQENFSSLAMIALTARAAEDDREQCIAAGADDIVVKPVEPRVLKQALDRCLDGHAKIR